MYYKPCHPANYSDQKRTKDHVKYIVVHYTGNNGDTARNNLEFFAREATKTSAHYFVDENEVCCSVPWFHTAYHCGGSVQSGNPAFYRKCTNSNSIGVELCSRKRVNGNYYFLEKTVSNAAAFVAQLMKDYNVPIERVIRHYDVVGKICPAPFIDEKEWAAFKNLVVRKYDGEEDEAMYYEKLEEIPAGELRETVATLMEQGIVKGKSTGLHLSEDMVRVLVFCYRMIKRA